MAMMRKRKDDVIFSYPIATTRAHGKTVRGEVLGSAEGTPAFWDPPTTTLFSSIRGYLVATHEVKGEAILGLGWQPEGAKSDPTGPHPYQVAPSRANEVSLKLK